MAACIVERINPLCGDLVVRRQPASENITSPQGTAEPQLAVPVTPALSGYEVGQFGSTECELLALEVGFQLECRPPTLPVSIEAAKPMLAASLFILDLCLFLRATYVHEI